MYTFNYFGTYTEGEIIRSRETISFQASNYPEGLKRGTRLMKDDPIIRKFAEEYGLYYPPADGWGLPKEWANHETVPLCECEECVHLPRPGFHMQQSFDKPRGLWYTLYLTFSHESRTAECPRKRG